MKLWFIGDKAILIPNWETIIAYEVERILMKRTTLTNSILAYRLFNPYAATTGTVRVLGFAHETLEVSNDGFLLIFVQNILLKELLIPAIRIEQ